MAGTVRTAGISSKATATTTDSTRAISFMVTKEATDRNYPWLGFTDGHHELSHHGGDAEKIAKVLRIKIFHVKTFAYFLEKMRSTPDGDGSLLDHSMIVYGSGLSDGNRHLHENLPAVLAGRGCGKASGSRY